MFITKMCLVSVVSHQGPSQRKLYHDLMSGYNPLERPVFNDSQSLSVYFGLSLMQIMDVVSKLSPTGSLENYYHCVYLKSWKISSVVEACFG